MAEGDGACYGAFFEALMKGEIDLVNDTLKLIMVAGHTPDTTNDDSYDSSIQGDEVSGTGYTAGGETLANQAVTEEAGPLGKFDADDETWTGLDVGTPSHVILYDDTHASDCLICYWECTTPTNGGNYTIQFHADGVITLAGA